MANKHDLSDQAVDAAKQLAPWSTALPWWVVLIEGIVLAAIGLYVILNPTGANVSLALALTAGLLIAGLLQVWGILRDAVPLKIISSVSARAAIAVYAGILILIFFFIEGALTRVAGFGAFGTAALIYGLLALLQVFRTDGQSRRQAIIEFLLFTSVGVITLWGLFAGGEAIVTAVSIVGWIFLIAGIALIAISIWRQQKGEEADEMIESFTSSLEDAGDKVTSIGHKSEKEIAEAKEDIAEAIEEVQDEADK